MNKSQPKEDFKLSYDEKFIFKAKTSRDAGMPLEQGH